MNIEHPKDLYKYLKETARLDPEEQLDMQVLAGGVSNRTVLVQRQQGRDLVIKQALEKLRVKTDWYSNPERIHREAAGMRYLYGVVPEHTTRLVFEDETAHMLAMEAVAQPHQNWKAMLLAGNVKPEHVHQFAVLLARIHREAFLANTDRSVQLAFADRSYFETLRIEPYYRYSAVQVSEASDFLSRLIKATRERLITLVHGDYSPKNILVYQDKLILLDHEVIHFGDPAFDLGFAMTHLLSKAHHLASQRQAFSEAAWQFWQDYALMVQDLPWFPDLEGFAVRHSLACLLARVAGRSPLEYLSKDARARQRAVVLDLIQQEPRSIEQLISVFLKGVGYVGHHKA